MRFSGFVVYTIAVLSIKITMNGSTVRVHLTGFDSFIHKTDAQPANEEMTLELMDGRKKHHPHVPILIYLTSEELVDPTDRPVKDSKDGSRRYFEFLGDSISFADQINNPLT